MSSEVRIGCSGWQYASWRGVLYPPGLPQRRWLSRYAEVFDTVEVNATFYRLARPAAVQAWIDATPPRFTFALKASRYLTHMKKLADLEPGLTRFFAGVAPLVATPRLGPVLWQLPGWFARDDARLDEALGTVTGWGGRGSIRHCVELRHPSWFAEPVYEILRRHRVALAIGDHPQRPWQPMDVLTADWTFVRLHHGARGRRGNYAPSELDAWAERLGALRERATVWAYFNNDWEGFAVRNAIALKRRLGRADDGHREDMTEENAQHQQEPAEDLTHEHGSLRRTASRTHPPGNGETDQADVDKGRDKLEQAGAGH
jgi:uncharacterized protein YecE (DUF72 family)